jgi:hypothetical protein
MQPILALLERPVWEKRRQCQKEKKKIIAHTYCKLTTLSTAGTIELNGWMMQCKGFGSREVAWGRGLVRLPPAAAKRICDVKKSIFCAHQILKYWDKVYNLSGDGHCYYSSQLRHSTHTYPRYYSGKGEENPDLKAHPKLEPVTSIVKIRNNQKRGTLSTLLYSGIYAHSIFFQTNRFQRVIFDLPSLPEKYTLTGHGKTSIPKDMPRTSHYHRSFWTAAATQLLTLL